MSASEKAPVSVVSVAKKRAEAPSGSLRATINQRQSRELVIAFSGPAGSGIRNTVKQFVAKAKNAGYQVVTIKLSDHIKSIFTSLKASSGESLPEQLQKIEIEKVTGYSRYEALQDIGNYLRGKYEPNILAQVALQDILLHRVEQAQPEYKQQLENKAISGDVDEIKYAIEIYVPNKTAYLIDQLKNPAEVELLRDVYGDLFYLIGNLSPEDQRKDNLKQEAMTEQDAVKVMVRDKHENEEHGQQLEKTLQLSDYFIRNSYIDHKDLDDQIDRFLRIIHRVGVITPTHDEYGMYIAHSAGLKSACLSRQVGAAIAAENGEIIATGCNDVPKSMGGLYSVNDEPDLRCYNKGGQCYNDDYKKRLIRNKIENILKDHDVKDATELAEEMYRSTRLKDLLEFSRSIHAEMDAIISLARNGGTGARGCTLYTTTYPCHVCAGHIIASGITRVVYIEPYEKSLAIELHGEAIAAERKSDSEVMFSHFVGVSPRRYQDFFLSNEERKDKNGKVVKKEDYSLKPKMHEYLDSYRTMEARVFKHLQQTGLTAPK